MPVPGCWSLKHLVLTMQNFATCCRSLQYSVVWWNPKINNSTGYGINRSPFCLHLVSLLHFYALLLFNVNLFPDVWPQKLRQKNLTLSEKLHVFYNSTTQKGVIKLLANESVQYVRLTEKSSLFPMVWLIISLVVHVFTS